jgi:site-specific recombinase XerD
MRLPNGYGSVYKLSGNRRKPYIARRTIGWDDNGKQLYANIGYYRTKAEALQALAAFNDNPYDLQLSRVTFAEIYDRWWNDTFDENSNRSTTKNYKAAYKHCEPLYDMKMSDVRPLHMQEVIDSCGAGYQTQKRIQILFNQLYRWCINHDAIQKNYAEQVTVTAKEAPKPRAAFSSEEIAKLWSSLNQHEYISIILMLIYSGVRISELLDLKKEDVNLEGQWFSVRHSKTEAGVRAVPIADKVLPFWQSFMDKSKSPYAVCTEDGKKLNYDNFIKIYWNPLMNELNMKHTPHETRHTFISLMVAANANQTILKKIVGHKSIMNLTEKVYTHVEIQTLLREVNLI